VLQPGIASVAGMTKRYGEQTENWRYDISVDFIVLKYPSNLNRESVKLGTTNLSKEQVDLLVNQMTMKCIGSSYHPINRYILYAHLFSSCKEL
jgi:hypothetical protein